MSGQASIVGADVFGGPSQDFTCPNSFLTRLKKGCGVLTARGVPVNVSLGNDTSGLYYWQACGDGFGIDVTHAAGTTAQAVATIIDGLVPVPSQASNRGC